MFSWNFFAFSGIQQMLAIWSLLSLPFLNLAWHSHFMYCWSLAWRILSITLPACANVNAKLLQSCPTLCDPIDGSPPGSTVPGILQASFQQYVNQGLPDVQAGFRKGRGTRDQIANICQIIKKPRQFQKNIYFFFIDYAKAFDCVDHNKLWKILQKMGKPDHLTCLLRNLYAGQETTVRPGHGKTDWFQIGKGVRQGCILSPCLFN